MALPAGALLGPYAILSGLGHGGQAEVYRARDARLDREVAIKILPPALAANAESLARFEREARTASALNHPHLVTIFDVGVANVGDSVVHYIAMELIRGTNLRNLLYRTEQETLLRYLADVGDGLARAHDAGVVHRDLKPENVMVSEDGFAKIVDFGLARRVPAADAATTRLTGEGMVMGTAAYMAPEQVKGRADIDHRADIFAFGCMIYEVVANENPFETDSIVGTMQRILTHQPPPLLFPELDSIARRCMAKDRNDRYASVREVVRDLRAAIAVTAIRPSPVAAPILQPRPRRGRTRFAVAGGVMVLLAAAVTAGVLFAHRTRPAAPSVTSLAVLPFQSAQRGSTGAPAAAGIADEVVHDLSHIHTLRVIAMSSVTRFANGADPREAAAALKVDAVLVGKLHAAGDQVVVDAELVRAADGTAMWGKRYSKHVSNLPALESEIAGDIASQVRSEVAPSTGNTRNGLAYEAYLRGLQEYRKQTPSSLKNAIVELRRALELDPTFARAWAALAQTHGRQSVLGLVPAQETLKLQEAEARQALSLDDSVAEAHWILSLVAELRGEDAEAERQLTRVLELDPNFALAWLHRASQFALARRFDEAEAAFVRARERDPLAPYPLTAYAVHLGLARQYEHARDLLLQAIEQYPDYQGAYLILAMVYSGMGQHDEAVKTLERVKQTDNPNFLVYKGIFLARGGRFESARAIGRETDAAAETQYLSKYYRAALHAALGDRDVALTMLEKAKADGDWQLRWLSYDPFFDVLRSEPRFAALLPASR